jgi:type IV pilus assembly protein PilQ
MDIHTKDSSGGLTTDLLPEEASTELVTNIIVRDGQTIVIGGLFRDKITNKKTQVPLLGDIPILGFLFRGTSDESVREEVVVLLTPHIVTEVDQTLGRARAADIGLKRRSAIQAIQGTGRARLAEDLYTSAARYYAIGEYEKALADLDGALTIRPTYLESLRLKERIIRELVPDADQVIDRTIVEAVEAPDSKMWLRR